MLVLLLLVTVLLGCEGVPAVDEFHAGVAAGEEFVEEAPAIAKNAIGKGIGLAAGAVGSKVALVGAGVGVAAGAVRTKASLAAAAVGKGVGVASGAF